MQFWRVAIFFLLCFSWLANMRAENAYDWALLDLEGNPVHLSYYQSKIVVLVFWATWCPDCREEIPSLIDIQNNYGGKGVAVIGISIDKGGVDLVKKSVVQNHINYTVVMGDQITKEAYGGIHAIPATFVIDRNGAIIRKFTDTDIVRKVDLEKVIRPLIAANVPASTPDTSTPIAPAESPSANGTSSSPPSSPISTDALTSGVASRSFQSNNLASADDSKSTSQSPVPASSQIGGFFKQFDGGPVSINNRTRMEDYDFNLSDETYYLYIPKTYNGTDTFGLIGFVSSGDVMQIPSGWEKVLEDRKLIYIAAQKVGNSQRMERRSAVTLAGIERVMKEYKIDPARVYLSGISGGARMSVISGLQHPDLISGIIPICGADYFRPVPKVEATTQDRYGINRYDQALVESAKAKEKIALITGEKDWRRGNILDIYNGAYVKDGFDVKIWDVPGMGHEICDSEVLAQAIDFMEGKDGKSRPALTATP